MRDAELVKAAAFEVEVRERVYPKLVANGKLTADEATIDFQAWTLILDFVDTGQLRSIDTGGVNGRTVVDWVLCEAAAQRALDALTADAEAAELAGEAKAARLWERRANVNLILGMVSRRRASVEHINRRIAADRLANGRAAA